MAEQKYTVYTPNPGFTGSRNGVYFKNGKGQADEVRAIQLVKIWGYSCPDLFPQKDRVDEQGTNETFAPAAESEQGTNETFAPAADSEKAKIKRFEPSSGIKKWRDAVKAIDEYSFNNVEELDEFVAGDSRKSVQAAADIRRKKIHT